MILFQQEEEFDLTAVKRILPSHHQKQSTVESTGTNTTPTCTYVEYSNTHNLWLLLLRVRGILVLPISIWDNSILRRN